MLNLYHMANFIQCVISWRTLCVFRLKLAHDLACVADELNPMIQFLFQIRFFIFLAKGGYYNAI